MNITFDRVFDTIVVVFDGQFSVKTVCVRVCVRAGCQINIEHIGLH